MFGFSPVMMAKETRPPFSYSGGWDADGDGWNTESIIWTPFGGRTSPGCLTAAFTTTPNFSSATYTIPAEVCGGRYIQASVWQKISTDLGSGTDLTRRLQYAIGGGAFVTLQTVTNRSTTYAQLSGGFNNPTESAVTIRIQGQVWSFGDFYSAPSFDDWAISGA